VCVGVWVHVGLCVCERERGVCIAVIRAAKSMVWWLSVGVY